LPHQAEIDPKYHFLFDAPLKDDAGNRSQIRYSRKTKEQYVMTDVDGKATGWRAFFQNGAWVVDGSAVAPKKTAKKKAPAKKKVAAKRKVAAKKTGP
jgi:DNA topoisomerase-1